jgi:hypothetical protein
VEGGVDKGDGVEEVWIVAGPVAVAGTVGCAAIVVASFDPDGARLPDLVTLPVQATAPLIAVLAVATIVGVRARRGLLAQLAESAPSILPVTGLLIAAFWGFQAFGMNDLTGGIDERNGRYYVGQHPEREITRTEYDRLDNLRRRETAGLCGMLYGPGVGFAIHARFLRQARRAEEAARAAAPPPPPPHGPRRAKARRHSRRKRARLRR